METRSVVWLGKLSAEDADGATAVLSEKPQGIPFSHHYKHTSTSKVV